MRDALNNPCQYACRQTGLGKAQTGIVNLLGIEGLNAESSSLSQRAEFN